MRQIGHIDDKNQAATFSDYLYNEGFENEVEEEGGRFAVWIHDEDRLEEAQDELKAFLSRPGEARYRQGAEEGRRKWNEARRKEKKSRSEVVDMRTRWGKGGGDGEESGAFITTGLLVISIGVFLVMIFAEFPIQNRLFISAPGPQAGFLPEVFSGQVWRVITPIFLHFTLLHIFFNMMWLRDLGALVEQVHGTAFFAALVLIFAIPSNLGQYIISGPNFGGMSGVVYGLFGFVWFRSKFDPRVQYGLPQFIVIMMVAWFFLGVFQIIGNIANVAHGVGFVLGMASGFLTSGRVKLG